MLTRFQELRIRADEYFYEQVDEVSDSMRRRAFLEELNNCHVSRILL
jgi:hypothetical protein